jgi:hypothetical protein
MEPAPTARHRGGGRDRSKPKGERSSRGRFQCINAFLDVTMAGLDRAELAVWLLLWRDTKPDGLARTWQGDLARRAGCNPRTVRRALAALQRAGLVSVVRQGGLNRGAVRLPRPSSRRGRGPMTVAQRAWASACQRAWVSRIEGVGALCPTRDQKRGPLAAQRPR